MLELQKAFNGVQSVMLLYVKSIDKYEIFFILAKTLNEEMLLILLLLKYNYIDLRYFKFLRLLSDDILVILL